MTPPPFAGVVAKCPLCGELVDPTDSSTLQRIEGWERVGAFRPSGVRGGSDIRLRERRQEWAHPYCVERARQGVAPTQAAIV